jgi:thioredoxin 1
MQIYEVVNNTLPNENLYLLDFYATWCNPCKMLSKVIEDMESNVPVYKVNIEENMELAKKYNVRGVPALALIKNDEPVATKSGYMKEAELSAFIEGHR